jgi:8-oxo-dGTP pyrophosphatase MutT (NUDIX family)
VLNVVGWGSVAIIHPPAALSRSGISAERWKVGFSRRLPYFPAVKWREPESSNGWSSTDRTTEYSDEHLCVVSEQVVSPRNDKGKSWTTVHRKQAVVIAAMTRDQRFVLVSQERIPIRRTIWEMPAGQVDEVNPADSEVEMTALRELQEETGYVLGKGGELINLGHFFASPGFTDEREHLFLARPVEPTEKRVSEESIVDCRAFTVDEIGDMIARDEICDANTLSAFARLIARGLIHVDRAA